MFHVVLLHSKYFRYGRDVVLRDSRYFGRSARRGIFVLTTVRYSENLKLLTLPVGYSEGIIDTREEFESLIVVSDFIFFLFHARPGPMQRIELGLTIL